MARASSPDVFSQQIEQLLSDRKEHVASIEHIDHILAGIGEVLTGVAERSGLISRVADSASSAAITARNTAVAKAPKAAAAKGRGKGKRGRGRFEQSGEEMVVAFVKSNKGATTRDINDAWQSEGRAGSADNALGKLVREKRLNRAKIKGERGSRYSVGK